MNKAFKNIGENAIIMGYNGQLNVIVSYVSTKEKEELSFVKKPNINDKDLGLEGGIFVKNNPVILTDDEYIYASNEGELTKKLMNLDCEINSINDLFSMIGRKNISDTPQKILNYLFYMFKENKVEENQIFGILNQHYDYALGIKEKNNAGAKSWNHGIKEHKLNIISTNQEIYDNRLPQIKIQSGMFAEDITGVIVETLKDMQNLHVGTMILKDSGIDYNIHNSL